MSCHTTKYNISMQLKLAIIYFRNPIIFKLNHNSFDNEKLVHPSIYYTLYVCTT